MATWPSVLNSCGYCTINKYLCLTGFSKRWLQKIGLFSPFWCVSAFFSFRSKVDGIKTLGTLVFLIFPSLFLLLFGVNFMPFGPCKKCFWHGPCASSDMFERYVLSNPVTCLFFIFRSWPCQKTWTWRPYPSWSQHIQPPCFVWEASALYSDTQAKWLLFLFGMKIIHCCYVV